eukprot:UN03754
MFGYMDIKFLFLVALLETPGIDVYVVPTLVLMLSLAFLRPHLCNVSKKRYKRDFERLAARLTKNGRR